MLMGGEECCEGGLEPGTDGDEEDRRATSLVMPPKADNSSVSLLIFGP